MQRNVAWGGMWLTLVVLCGLACAGCKGHDRPAPVASNFDNATFDGATFE